jgi:hypothetical protein
MSLAIWAILLPLEVANDPPMPPWKVVAFDCSITLISGRYFNGLWIF